MLRKSFPLTLIAFSLAGCAPFKRAEIFPIVGAYFPGWLICLFIGVISSVFLRILALKLDIDRFLSYRLFTYLSLGAMIGLLFWTVYFGS